MSRQPPGTPQPPPKIGGSALNPAGTVPAGAAGPGLGLNPSVAFGAPFYYTGLSTGTGVQADTTGGGLEDPHGRPAQLPNLESTPVPGQP